MKNLVFALLALFSSTVYGQSDWLSSAGMTQVMNGVDDGTFHVPLEHNFPYYGGVFTDAWMSSNGVIMLYDPVSQFGNPNTNNSMCCNGIDLAGSNAGSGYYSFMIAPLWTDLRHDTSIADSGYFYKTNEEVSSFLWKNITEYATTNTNTFQVNMWPDGSFDFLYDEVDITYHNVFIGNTGNLAAGELNQLQYAQGSIDEFQLDFISETFNGGRAWYGQDGGYQANGPDCSNALNDSSCPGYEEAYYDQQCSSDPLYDYGCQGYEQAYLDQQCTYDELYDPACPGYDNAILVQNASGTDFIFGDDISDFYEPVVEDPNMFPPPPPPPNTNAPDIFNQDNNAPEMFAEPEPMYQETPPAYVEEPQVFEQEPFQEEVYVEPVNTRPARREPVQEIEEPIEESVPAEERIEPREEISPVEEVIVAEEIPQPQESVSPPENLTQERVNPVRVDAIGLALDTAASAQDNAIQTASYQSTQSYTSSDSVSAFNATNLSEQNFSSSISNALTTNTTPMNNTLSQETSAFVSYNTQSKSYESSPQDNMSNSSNNLLNSTDDMSNNQSELHMKDEFSFDSQDSFFENATFSAVVNPAVVVVAEQSQEEQQTADFQMESSATQQGGGFASQQNQSFSTGQSISAVLNNVQPNFSRFDVAPPSQQEQQTTAKAESQADNMSDEQLEENLDEFADTLQDSGGFTDQSMTVFLMGRNSAFSQYSGQLQDVSFYTDRGMPGGSVQNDRNSMLRMMGTDNKHEELISLQYK